MFYTENLLEFEILSRNAGNNLKFDCSSWKFVQTNKNVAQVQLLVTGV